MELIKRRGTLVVVSAPSGAGKTTLCHEVRSLVPDLYYSVSYTTRAPRVGEMNGTDFHFVNDAEFVAMRDRDEFAEWASVHEHLYGTPAKALEGALRRGPDVILDIYRH
jgi:guanylate kinase